MFNFFKEKKEKKAREKHTYDLEIDNLAAATGQKVTIFFTFWGLNVIKKLHKPETEKKESPEEEQPSVTYDTVAIPEIHIPKKKS